MKKLMLCVVLSTLGVISSGWVNAASSIDVGKNEFRNGCAVCHGADGKGGGAIVDLLKKTPPDLTLLSKKNAGKFPAERIAAMIDGPETVKGHGGRDMPAWGDRYSKDSVRAAAYYCDVPYMDTAKFVKNRINALIEYLKSIQAK